MKGILYYHQGWTDIINCLPLIDYYLEYYDEIYLFMREDSRKFVDFYISNKNNRIILIYINKNILDKMNTIEYFKNNIDNNINNYNILYHGAHDIYRIDNYKNAFNNTLLFFVESFYSLYNIPYINRINYFNLKRDCELENYKYDEFIKIYGQKYILQHEIDVTNIIPVINLNNISDTFFDYIKILENAEEIHLLDSVWGAIIYLLDTKYNLFKNIKIYMYCKRGYNEMFEKPIKLENWIFI